MQAVRGCGGVLDQAGRLVPGRVGLGLRAVALHEPDAPGQVLQPRILLAIVLRGRRLRARQGFFEPSICMRIALVDTSWYQEDQQGYFELSICEDSSGGHVIC